MDVVRTLLGRPLSAREEGTERPGVWAGVAVSGFDALGPAVYGSEAAMTMLLPARLAGLADLAVTIASHWFQHLMHNDRAMRLKWKLFIHGNRRAVMVDMPWQLPRVS
jgi:hypothetical protein